MLCASVWLRTATGLKSERADPGVTAHLRRAAGEALAECASVYDGKHSYNKYLSA